MIIGHPTHLPFTGLKKIQNLLMEYYSKNPSDDNLVITASIPSLDLTQKNQLIEEIKKHKNIIFWCYGDFLWNLDFFSQIHEILVGKNIVWITASERWRKLLSLYIPNENILVHGHPFKIAPQRADRERIRKELGLDEADKLIFFAGRQNPSKNIPLLIKVWDLLRQEKNRQVRLVIAGTDCNYKAKVQSSAMTSGNGIKTMQTLYPENIFVSSGLNDEEMRSYLEAADLAFTGSTFLEEDYGLFIREARFVGCPVLASNWGGHADLNDQGSSLFDIKLINNQTHYNLDEIEKKAEQAFSMKRTTFDYSRPVQFSNFSMVKFKGFKNGLALPSLEIMNSIMVES